jgi:hypothetical protein
VLLQVLPTTLLMPMLKLTLLNVLQEELYDMGAWRQAQQPITIQQVSRKQKKELYVQ